MIKTRRAGQIASSVKSIFLIAESKRCICREAFQIDLALARASLAWPRFTLGEHSGQNPQFAKIGGALYDWRELNEMARSACFSRQRGADAKADQNDFLDAKRLAHPGGRFFDGTTPTVVRHKIVGVVERIPRAGIIEAQGGEARRGEIIGEDAPRLMRAERLVTHGRAHHDATIAVGVVKPSETLADRDGRRRCQNQDPCCWDREIARPRLRRESF